MNGKIFVAYHFTPEPCEALKDELYEPLVMENHEEGSEYTKGNLPPDDRRFDAYEAMKWDIWTNRMGNYEWIGLQQYRRSLDFSTVTSDVITQHDIVTCPVGDENIRYQYILNHGQPTWDALVKVLGPDYDFEGRFLLHGGLGIMRATIFNDYMTQQEHVFQELTKLISPDPSDQRRSAFAERFFSLYFHRLLKEHPELKVLHLPLLVGTQLHYQGEQNVQRNLSLPTSGNGGREWPTKAHVYPSELPHS